MLNLSTCPGLVHNRAPFKEKDISSSPKFTAPLVDRSVVAGYSAAISCAVRGFPKVRTYFKVRTHSTREHLKHAGHGAPRKNNGCNMSDECCIFLKSYDDRKNC